MRLDEGNTLPPEDFQEAKKADVRAGLFMFGLAGVILILLFAVGVGAWELEKTNSQLAQTNAQASQRDAKIGTLESSLIEQQEQFTFCAHPKNTDLAYCQEPVTPPVDSIEGPRGEAGQQGSPGRPGDDGDDGDDGKDGIAGTSGPPGDKGTNGANGLPGKDGAPGSKGDPGEPGKNGEPGKDGKDGKDGAKGDKGDPGINGQDGLPPYIFTFEFGLQSVTCTRDADSQNSTYTCITTIGSEDGN